MKPAVVIAGQIVTLLILNQRGDAIGLALGTISHGQGTAQAVSEGELSGAAAGIAMSLAAVFTACVAPFVVPILK